MPKLRTITIPSGASTSTHIRGPLNNVCPRGVRSRPAPVWVTAAENVSQATMPVSATPTAI